MKSALVSFLFKHQALPLDTTCRILVLYQGNQFDFHFITMETSPDGWFSSLLQVDVREGFDVHRDWFSAVWLQRWHLLLEELSGTIC